jgi:hypothetical protein
MFIPHPFRVFCSLFSSFFCSALFDSQLTAARSEIAAARAAADTLARELSAVRAEHQQALLELQQLQQRNAALNSELSAGADADAAARQMRERVNALETRCFDAERALAEAHRSSAQVCGLYCMCVCVCVCLSMYVVCVCVCVWVWVWFVGV